MTDQDAKKFLEYVKKWQEIADVLNEYVDKLNEAHFANGLEHFTKEDIVELSKQSGLTIEPTKIEGNGKWGLVDIFRHNLLFCHFPVSTISI